MPSWTRRSGGRIARRNIHIPDWESWIRARYRSRNVAFKIAFPIRCMPLIASPPRWDMRLPDTKSARSDSNAVRKSGKRSAGYVRSASRAAMYAPRASWKPVLYARPYPRRGSGITRAPFAVAISRVRSRESVSTTRISNKRGPSAFRTSDRKSTRLNSSHLVISYAVFCLKKKNLDQSSITDHAAHFRRSPTSMHAIFLLPLRHHQFASVPVHPVVPTVHQYDRHCTQLYAR